MIANPCSPRDSPRVPFPRLNRKTLMIRYTLLSFLFLASVSGCSKKTPVEELSVDQSGVEIIDQAVLITDTDWPMWRGPNVDGLAPDQPLPTSWSADEGVAWRALVPGRGHGSPILVGDQVVVATALDDEQKQLVISFDRNDGTERWRTIIHEGGFPSKREIHNKGTNANSTVASDGERFFTAMLNSQKLFVTALDLEGNQLWQREAGSFQPKFGYAPSPLIYKSLVIIAADNQGGGYLAAFDRTTGEPAWRTARGNISSYSSATVGNLGGRDQLLISGCDSVSSYDPATGELLWETPCIAEATCGTVVIAGDRLVASGGYPDKETVCLSGKGEKLWSNGTKVYEPSLIAHDGLVFAVSDDGIAYCWSLEDGEQMWRKRLGGNFSGSPVICNGNVYVANLSGDCFVFRASDENYEQIAKNKLGSDCYASPAIGNSQIVFRIGTGSGGDRQESLVCVAAPE